MESTCVVWFRRDLRLDDNPALVYALQNFSQVIPFFVWACEEEGQFQPGRQSRWWTKQTVADLRDKLAALGSRLVLRRARDSCAALKQLVAESGATALVFNNLYDSVSLVRDRQVKEELGSIGVRVASFNADLLYEPWQVLDDEHEPFTTFKDFWDRCLSMPYAPPLPLPPPAALPPVPDHIIGVPVAAVDWFASPEQEAATQALAHRWDPRPEAARTRLDKFLATALPTFEHDRAKTDRASTTMLSPWIHAGSLSVRAVYYAVAARHAAWCAEGAGRARSCLEFLQQLGYREYSRYLSFHFPFITERAMLAHLRAVPWRLDAGAFKAWRQGLTGYPLVDAAMRQLSALGWVHNRARVVAASFLVKHLLLPWQWGLKHLWDCQIDADLECDALGWQYVAGCLADAHPFSHMVDLTREARRFDPDGEYVRRWLPVLAALPAAYVHAPWDAPPEVLLAAGVELGVTYPARVVLPDDARRGVEFAAQIIELCASGGAPPAAGTVYPAPVSSGAAAGVGGGGGGTSNTGGGTPGHSTGGVSASGGGGGGGGGGAGTGTGGNTGGTSSTGTALPRKEPYRPPTDETLLVGFLDAARRARAAADLVAVPDLVAGGAASGGALGGFAGGAPPQQQPPQLDAAGAAVLAQAQWLRQLVQQQPESLDHRVPSASARPPGAAGAAPSTYLPSAGAALAARSVTTAGSFFCKRGGGGAQDDEEDEDDEEGVGDAMQESDDGGDDEASGGAGLSRRFVATVGVDGGGGGRDGMVS